MSRRSDTCSAALKLDFSLSKLYYFSDFNETQGQVLKRNLKGISRDSFTLNMVRIYRYHEHFSASPPPKHSPEFHDKG